MSPPFIKKFQDKLKRKNGKSPGIATAATSSTASQSTALSKSSIEGSQQGKDYVIPPATEDDPNDDPATAKIHRYGLTDLTSDAEREKTFIE
ncbi:hypothetical protein PG996_002649 [Apiospora saccharicola]|uniref:Uncharacterized protein n=1 Tax=Apiospora saccharicola TaxID=335842 RepID=A0ABR1WPE5_9PEZI